MIVASTVSAPHPFDGEDARSSKNFKFFRLDDDLTVQLKSDGDVSTIQCDLAEDTLVGDPVIAHLKQGTLIPRDAVGTGASYYLSNPEGTERNFTVSFVARS